jgi:hypothetical protein
MATPSTKSTMPRPKVTNWNLMVVRAAPLLSSARSEELRNNSIRPAHHGETAVLQRDFGRRDGPGTAVDAGDPLAQTGQ